MDIKRKLLVLLAIFCIIGSAGLVCAAEDGGFAGSDYQYMNDVNGSQAYDGGYAGSNYDGGYAGSQYYNNAEPGNGLPLENQTNPFAGNATGNATGNSTHNAAGAANATGNATPATSSHNMLATGNPILALLAVTAIIGGYGIIKRDK